MTWTATGVLLVGCTLAAGCGAPPPEVHVEEPHLRALQTRAVDSSGFGNDGVIQGSPERGVPGHRGTAYRFSGPHSWIRISSTPQLNPEEASFLVAAWVNLVSAPVVGESVDVVRKGLSDSTGGEFKLEIVAGGRIKCTVKDATFGDASKFGADVVIADGTWHRIGCARTPNRLSAIVDEEVFSKRVRTGVVDNDFPLAIGSKYGIEDGLTGRIDEVMICVVAADARRPGPAAPPRREIERLQRPEHLVGLWRLDEPAAS